VLILQSLNELMLYLDGIVTLGQSFRLSFSDYSVKPCPSWKISQSVHTKTTTLTLFEKLWLFFSSRHWPENTEAFLPNGEN
jgi:hypothetical protein